jgi:hypothetical protein
MQNGLHLNHETKQDEASTEEGRFNQAFNPLGFQGQELLSQPRTLAVKHTHVVPVAVC